MYREKLRKPEKWLPVGAGAILGGIALALLFPVAGHGAMAAEDLPTMTTGVNSNMTTLVRSSVAVALSSKVDLDVTPKSTGAFSTSSADLKVTTNNTTGYAVYMQTADNTSELKATNPHVDESIAPVSGTMTEENFASNLNTWGYAIGSANSNTEYRAVPQAGDEAIVKTTGMSQEDDYDLSFAVAVGTDLPAGLYTNQLVVSVVANPIEVRSLIDINYMQDMTAEICAITFEGETKQLIDTRDGKSYWVAKLKDGNCWMTQNLALDLDTNEVGNAVAVAKNGSTVELNSDNTNIAAVWKGATKTETSVPEARGDDYVSARSWNFGQIVLVNPIKTSTCDSIFPGGNITDCAWYKDVSELTPGYEATETSAISSDGQSYDSHYLIGNYYQWNTAVAGSGAGLSNVNTTSSVDLVDASESICPKGWRLPASGRYYDSNNEISYPYEREDSFMNLFMAYGYPAGNAGAGWDSKDGSPNVSINEVAGYVVNYKPMHFVRSGSVVLASGLVRSLGINSVYWSSTPSSLSSGFALLFGPSNLYPSNHYGKDRGFSVRCLVKK